MNENTLKKLKILAESAKYDVSCSSSGTRRGNQKGGIGSAEAFGCCHSFTEDGRCVSLLKVLFSNQCVYDCAYCINRVSNDLPRASFSVRELVDLTIGFYRRNYIEGLFLSSAVLVSADHTMSLLVDALRELRTRQRFNGYIHMKCIPGCSRELVHQAGLYADRLSVNIEIPSESSLKRLAPEKDHQSVYQPMYHIRQGVLENREERKKFRSAPRFAPAGQSTQMIIGASAERDRDILLLSSRLYKGPELKRVYYSGFVPVNAYDNRLPSGKPVPLVRENRLYQADWLMRLYHFEAEEILDEANPHLDLEVDPKIAWALRHPEFFPLDVNRADYAQILRVPGIGLKSAQRIVAARRYRTLTAEHLKRMGVVMGRARFFLADLSGLNSFLHETPGVGLPELPVLPAVEIGGQAQPAPGGGQFLAPVRNLPAARLSARSLPVSPSGRRWFTIQEAGPEYVRRALLGNKKPKALMEQLSLFERPDPASKVGALGALGTLVANDATGKIGAAGVGNA